MNCQSIVQPSVYINIDTTWKKIKPNFFCDYFWQDTLPSTTTTSQPLWIFSTVPIDFDALIVVAPAQGASCTHVVIEKGIMQRQSVRISWLRPELQYKCKLRNEIFGFFLGGPVSGSFIVGFYFFVKSLVGFYSFNEHN